MPSPKKNTSYSSGFEHVEFVSDIELDLFIKKYSWIDFDIGGMNKSLNPEIRVSLKNGLSVKFHPMSLDKVIEIEKRQMNKS